jgi:hypothetical protein
MPHSGSVTFADLIDRLEMLRVTCIKCGREGRYMVRRLAAKRGANARLTDFLAEVTADCPRRRSIDMADQCSVGMPDLVRVL